MLNKLKSSYEELEIKPSSDLWNRLDNRIDESSEKVLIKPFQWWKYAAVVLLFVSVSAVFYFNTEKKAYNYKETDYMVKKGMEKTVNPINPEFQNQVSLSEPQITNQVKTTDVKITRYQKKEVDSFLHKNKTERIFKPVTIGAEIQNLAVKEPEKADISPVNIEIHRPVIAQGKSATPTYINSNELLLGREFDKARGTSNEKDIKFGIFNFEKPKPKVENVTVLGVTVYVDPK